MSGGKRRPAPPELIAEATKYPGGWVYEIAPGYDPNGAVPPDAIVGAWKVDDEGRLTGEFTSNPNYRPA